MRITITDDHGNVFAVHNLSHQDARESVREREEDPGIMGLEADIGTTFVDSLNRFYSDLQTAIHNQAKDPDWNA